MPYDLTPLAVPNWASGSPITTPIPASPVLDPDSAKIVAALAAGQGSVVHVAEYGVPVKVATANTPRWNLVPTQTGNWGDNPFAGYTVPMEKTWLTIPVARDGDGHISIYDPTNNVFFDMWDADFTGPVPACSWGAVTPAGTKTITSKTGTATAAGFGLYAGLITEDEIAAGVINHALVFSSDICRPGALRAPAIHQDGKVVRSGTVDASATITQGARLQMDPTFDVDAQTQWAPFQRMVAKALQTYGAYCIDCGGAPVAIMAQLPDKASWGKVGTTLGIANGSYVYAMNGLTEMSCSIALYPWASRFRVLRSWDGS